MMALIREKSFIALLTWFLYIFAIYQNEKIKAGRPKPE